MRFLISVVDRVTGSASGDEIAAIDAFNDRLRAEGLWVLAGGLEAPEHAVTIDARGDLGGDLRGDLRGAAARVADGPLHDPAHAGGRYVAGFWVIDAPDRDVALALAKEASHACNREVEVRAFL